MEKNACQNTNQYKTACGDSYLSFQGNARLPFHSNAAGLDISFYAAFDHRYPCNVKFLEALLHHCGSITALAYQKPRNGRSPDFVGTPHHLVKRNEP